MGRDPDIGDTVRAGSNVRDDHPISLAMEQPAVKCLVRFVYVAFDFGDGFGHLCFVEATKLRIKTFRDSLIRTFPISVPGWL